MTERTLTAEVEGVGSFVFRKRTLEMQLRIEADAERMTGGPVQSKGLYDFAVTVAALRRLIVTAPEDFDLDDIDPTDDAAFTKLLSVYRGLREAEKTFRQGPAPARP